MGITFGDHLIDSGYYEPEEEEMPMPNDVSDLLPCPFCGNRVALSVLEDEPGELVCAWVACDCGVQISERPTEKETVDRWNRRASSVREG